VIHFKEKLLKLTKKKGSGLFLESTIEKSLISKCAIYMQGVGGGVYGVVELSNYSL